MGNKKLIILLKFAIYYKINVKHLLCCIEDQIFEILILKFQKFYTL